MMTLDPATLGTAQILTVIFAMNRHIFIDVDVAPAKYFL
jgi:hypothetical protein